MPDFTIEETEWLKENTITLAVDDTYPPLNYTNKRGELKGLNIDLIKLIEKKIGKEIILAPSSWSLALEKAMNHEVDGIINATPLEERRKSLNFSRFIMEDPQALICLECDRRDDNFSLFQHSRIAAKRGGRQLLLLRAHIPDSNIVEVETLFEAFNLMVRKEVDGIYDDLAPLYHLISISNIPDIRIAFIEYNEQGATIAIRNDSPVLLSIINKAIDSISEQERKKIQNNWISHDFMDYTNFYIAIVILLVISILIFTWNRTLKKIVKERTRQIENELVNKQKVELELKLALEKAEESEKLKSAFMANMSHEIRTPMNGILGFSEFFARPVLDDESRMSYAKMVIENGKRLLSIVNDILDISRIEAGIVRILTHEVELNDILQGLMESYQVDKTNSTIEISLFCGLQSSAAYIETDKNRLLQILNNLLSNAFKFTTEGSVKFGYEKIENHLKFYVSDTGIGIEEDYKDKIFDRFSQVELDLTQHYGGTGLGLAISKKLVELFGGKIWVESVFGKGSTFYFTIPYNPINKQDENNEQAYLFPEPEWLKNLELKILLVEDEEVNELYLTELLSTTNVEILIAKNGMEAIDICQEDKDIDLVLMDIKLPLMNGYDATKKIKEIRPNLPIIAQTAYAMPGDREKAMKAGCNEYVAKPINPEKLFLIIERYVK